MPTQVSDDESNIDDGQPVVTDAYLGFDEQGNDELPEPPNPTTPQNGEKSGDETIPGLSPLPQDRADDFPKLVLAELAATYGVAEQPVPPPVHPVRTHGAIPSQVAPSSPVGREASKTVEVSCWKIVLSWVH